MLQPNGSAPIHWAHVAGLAHAGVYIAVRDSVGKLLMLQRSTHVKTCNGSWGFLGEHCHVGESQRSSVQRALDEEMGTQLRLMHVERLLNISTVWYNQVRWLLRCCCESIVCLARSRSALLLLLLLLLSYAMPI